MVPAPPALPTRFPCWCRAIYSWGGESKRDLGFIEGDLIECLNAGDGSWWMGRLRRDRRVMGLFPSNFVEVLDESFQPGSRAASPIPEKTPSPYNNPTVAQPKTKPVRKPFQAYSLPDTAALKREELRKQESLLRSAAPSPNPRNAYNKPPRAISPNPMSHNNSVSRAVSPNPMGYHHGISRAASPAPTGRYNSISRAPSPNPMHHHGSISRAPSPLPIGHHNSISRAPSPNPLNYHNSISRAPSPNPMNYHHNISRAASPGPSFGYPHHSRSPSPNPYQDERGSSPPPPPPPHRSTYDPHAHTTPYQNHHTIPGEDSGGPPTPSPSGSRMTPSPLRSAMEDVMSSLQDMGLPRESETSEAPLDPWSPEAFDQTYIKAKREREQRPKSVMGIGFQEEANDTYNDPSFYNSSLQSRYSTRGQPPPQLSNYVERMESRLNKMYNSGKSYEEDEPPMVPPKSDPYDRPKSMVDIGISGPKPRSAKSAYDIGRSMLERTFTTKTNSTNSSSGGQSTTTDSSASTQLTDRSLMSGPSASGFSSTSAGSFARKKEAWQQRAHSAFGSRKDAFLTHNASQVSFSSSRPQTPSTGISYHSSHATGRARAQSNVGWNSSIAEPGNMLGGLVAPKPKKSGFFKKIIETAKTGAANARSNIVLNDSSKQQTMQNSAMGDGVHSIAGGGASSNTRNVASDMGLGGGTIDWVQIRRDVNRSNSLSRIERVERRERCQMMDYPAISAPDDLYENAEGDEGADGNPVLEPTNFQAVNLSLVDKNARFINNLPPTTNPISLATGFVCRPYRSDVQRLRAIFTWVSERITWEEDIDCEIDARKVIQTKRGCPEEVAALVMEMCAAVGIHAEVVRGYLKTPGEVPEIGIMPRSNHWWNAVIVDNEWRMMDCSLASPSHPRRGLYSSAGSQTAESWWFLARPTEICWTHVPEQYQQQHICPPIAQEVLLSLPCACPPYFKNGLQMVEYDTSLVRLEDLEMVHIRFTVPADVECVAEVEARAFERDADGDLFESGEVVKKRALAQAEWIGGQKRYTVKGLLPGDEGQGILKVYAGKRGLMHSIKDIPHPMAFALPIVHSGENPPYEFVTRHPTPHAQRHDLYVAQPQCQFLAMNNTFVFAVRQHPSSVGPASPNPGTVSPGPFVRPTSAMSMSSSSASGSNPSTTNAFSSKKPAKLAIQAPGGKILRLTRKEERITTANQSTEVGDGGTWETIIKCGERGVWRGLVLADRTARWCVFAEWICV